MARPFGVVNGLSLVALVLIAQTSWGQKLISRTRIGLGKADVRVPLTWITEQPQKGTAKAGDYGRDMTVNGTDRFYEMHVPASYDGSKAVPLVLVFHGGGGYPASVRFESGMDKTSDKNGFIVVYPAGTNKRFLKDRMLEWNDGRPYQDGSPKEIDDVAFVKAVIADVDKMFNIDRKRIYAAGFSNGSQFVNRLAQQMTDQLAAVAKVAGQRSPDELFGNPSRPISVMQFSGRQDPIAPYLGGAPKNFTPKFKTELKPVEQTIQDWVKFNGCPEKPEETKTVRNATMTKYGPGKDGTEVVLWTLGDGGHTWPGGDALPAAEDWGQGNINKDISASALIWNFFSAHSLK